MNQITFSDRTWVRTLSGALLFPAGFIFLGLAGWWNKTMGLNMEGVLMGAIVGALGAVLVYWGFKWLFHQKKLEVYFSKNQWKYREGGPWFGNHHEGHLLDLKQVEIHKTIHNLQVGDDGPITFAKVTYFYIVIRTHKNQLLFVAFKKNEEATRSLAQTLADQIQIPLQDYTAHPVETGYKSEEVMLDKFLKQPLP